VEAGALSFQGGEYLPLIFLMKAALPADRFAQSRHKFGEMANTICPTLVKSTFSQDPVIQAWQLFLLGWCIEQIEYHSQRQGPHPLIVII
jgi:hypothetical protein